MQNMFSLYKYVIISINRTHIPRLHFFFFFNHCTFSMEHQKTTAPIRNNEKAVCRHAESIYIFKQKFRM
ncbi:hypothetical protein XELAEV_18006237mg [Xenopus laevis]|uniref:Uncharacterized protein n=1 Tax=Xenopus laevis TaxID=8355 RepID=A0A974I3M5_XENLA|nr:hypothetical protein XELAEV_18006237mg [Xenopus laevis]